MINDLKQEIIRYIDRINHFYRNNSIKAYEEVVNVVSQTREESNNRKIQFVKLKDNTIEKMLYRGIKDLPMLERVGHVRENVLTEEEAKKLGYSTKNKHYHGLGVKTYLEIIDAMDNPNTIVYEYNDEPGHFIVETPVKINSIKTVVPVIIEQTGRYNNVTINFNKIMTAFAPRQDYINDLVKNRKIKEVVAGDNYQKALLNGLNITNNNNDVNYIIDNMLLLLSII